MSADPEPDIAHVLWLVFRNAVQKHIDSYEGFAESEAQYREKAEKAGLVAVANFVGLAYRSTP